MKKFIDKICPSHGKFRQRLDHHLSGHGCISCRNKNLSLRFRSNLEDFSRKASLIHKEKYDYSQVAYTNAHTKISIVCPLHGKFTQTPNKHLGGKGCPKCAGKNKTTLDFINQSNRIHGTYYDYSPSIYQSAKKKLKIICPKHGEFLQSPNEHLYGKGCQKCTHLVSKAETEFLDYLGVSTRNIRIPEWAHKSVDGYDASTNTIYEFLGDYWHGNPIVYDPIQRNVINKKTFEELYKNTFVNLFRLKSLGYNVNYIWETDWKKFKSGANTTPNIISI